jgi:hypothetical protein
VEQATPDMLVIETGQCAPPPAAQHKNNGWWLFARRARARKRLHLPHFSLICAHFFRVFLASARRSLALRLLVDGTRRVVAVSYARGALDSFTAGVDGPISLDVAKAKGYLESADVEEQAYYTDMLQALEMDTDDARGGLTPDATPYDEQ